MSRLLLTLCLFASLALPLEMAWTETFVRPDGFTPTACWSCDGRTACLCHVSAEVSVAELGERLPVPVMPTVDLYLAPRIESPAISIDRPPQLSL